MGVGFSKEIKEILQGSKKAYSLLERKEKINLFLATGIMLIAGFLTNLPAIILGRFVDTIIAIENPAFQMAIPFLSAIIGIVILKEMLTVLRKYLVENIATQTEKKQTVKVVKHVLKTDMQSFHTQQIGSLHGRIFRSIHGLIRLIKLNFLDFFPSIFAALAALTIAFVQKPILAPFMILVIPAGLFIVVKQIGSQKGIRIKLLRGKENIDGKVVEMMGGLETIRVTNTTEYEVKKIENVAEQLRKIEIKHHIWMSIYDAMKYFNEAFFYILVVSISIYFAVNGIITKGDILTYSILFMSVLSPLREVHRILDEAHESSIRVDDLYELLERPQDPSFRVKESKSKVTQKVIKIENLSFSYTNQKVLDNISVMIRKGEKIGIAGASGCGKSTFVKILLRLVHGYSGEIEILGKNLKNVSREEIAQKVSYVPQKTFIFSGTIKENIIYGTKKQSAIDAAKKAKIYDEIQSLGGMSGKVAENGNNLSGGQKQRLALARLICNDPEIIILDEATSALDNVNERAIQKSIEQIFKDKTTITIAHRLTTLKNVDRILVFDKGKIVQEGTFLQLSRKGLFKKFLEKQ